MPKLCPSLFMKQYNQGGEIMLIILMKNNKNHVYAIPPSIPGESTRIGLKK